jgi:lysozyme family protein
MATERTVTNKTMLENMKPKDTRLVQLNNLVARIVSNKARYEVVQKHLGTPWYIVAAIHYRECALSFNHHLHNGDPLSKRTVHVPAGRPATHEGPFNWEESAIDALQDRKFSRDQDLGDILDEMEKYNGLGYKRKGLPSPYVWSWTDQYKKGKYVSDGKFDPDFVDQQCGVAPLIVELQKFDIK